MKNIFPSNKKGAIGIGNGPQVVMIVGFIFLIMATIAYVASEYQDAFTSDKSVTVTNESFTSYPDATTGVALAQSTLCNFGSITGVVINNATGGESVPSTNYTVSSVGLVTFDGTANDAQYNNSLWNVSYSATYSGTACNVTTDLQTELSDNTSIAGIVLTISLIGIVLSILVGVFVMARRRSL